MCLPTGLTTGLIQLKLKRYLHWSLDVSLELVRCHHRCSSMYIRIQSKNGAELSAIFSKN